MRLALSLCLIALSIVACGGNRGPIRPGSEVDGGPIVPPGTDGGPAPEMDAQPTPAGTMPGSACRCDAQCAGTATHPGVCVQGICMHRASATCAAAGSSGECPSGSRCWGLTGFEGSICWPDCASYGCDGACDGDGSCVPDESSSCDASCSEHCTGDEPPPPPVDGGTIDLGTPPAGPPPSCAIGAGTIPDWRCTGGAAHCAELVAFEPVMGPGYWNYPLNGETESNQYRSYVRRDVMMLVKYAAAMVDCQSQDWTFGNGGPLGLGDMSEADGSIPGTSIGEPGHPAGTHVDGHDMDIAYFQTGTADNRLRPVCAHTSGGADQYHCTGEPTMLDAWRTALFLGHLHVSPQLRVIGVDGRVGPRVDAAIDHLCGEGFLSGEACGSHQITWEATDTGRGWFRFHHHHFHISISSP